MRQRQTVRPVDPDVLVIRAAVTSAAAMRRAPASKSKPVGAPKIPAIPHMSTRLPRRATLGAETLNRVQRTSRARALDIVKKLARQQIVRCERAASQTDSFGTKAKKRNTRTYLKTSKLPEEDADGGELDEAEKVDRVILPANQ
jgi:hypothetical protein